MKCPACQKDCPDDMAICGYCGASLSKSAMPMPPNPSRAPEEELWVGRFSFRAVAHQWLLYGLWLGLLAYIVLHPDVWKEVQANLWMQYAAAALATLPLLALIVKVVYRKMALRYRLTTQRLFITYGVLLRTIDELELIRVDDIQVRQSLFNRIFNVGTIVVLAPTDQTDPEVHLIGVTNPIEVKEKIREYVRRMKQTSIRMDQV